MKKRLNYIDYGIILVAIIITFVLGVKIKNVVSARTVKGNGTQNTRKEIVIKVKDVREYSVNALKAGDNIYSDDTNHYFGKIKEVKIEDSYVFLVKNNGEVVTTRSPERYDITLILECNILEKPDGIFAEGITEIKVNSIGKYKTIGLLFSAMTLSIEE